ncbi:MAG: hypothetical protein GX801_07140 [Fibrobacter sp.]|nr:hypothetical protein [Fibrobacter sp.]
MRQLSVLTLLSLTLLSCHKESSNIKIHYDTLTVAIPQQKLWEQLRNISSASSDFIDIRLQHSHLPDSLSLVLTPQRKHYYLQWDMVLEALPPDSTRVYLQETQNMTPSALKFLAKFTSPPTPTIKESVFKSISP